MLREEQPDELEQLVGLAMLLGCIKPLKSRRQKVEFLADSLKREWWLEKWIRLALDPLVQFGITSREARKSQRVQGLRPKSILKLLKAISNGQMGEGLAEANWYTCVKDLGKEVRLTANRILDKDLKSIDVELTNEAFKEIKLKSIPVIKLPPVKDYEKGDLGKDDICFASRIPDGFRSLVILRSNADPLLFDEDGDCFWDETIIDAFMEYDDEWQFTENDVAIEGYLIEETLEREACFFAVDMIPLKAFLAGRTKSLFSERHAHLTEAIWTISSRNIKGVKQTVVQGKKEYKAFKRKAVEKNWNGIALRKDTNFDVNQTSIFEVNL